MTYRSTQGLEIPDAHWMDKGAETLGCLRLNIHYDLQNLQSSSMNHWSSVVPRRTTKYRVRYVPEDMRNRKSDEARQETLQSLIYPTSVNHQAESARRNLFSLATISFAEFVCICEIFSSPLPLKKGPSPIVNQMLAGPCSSSCRSSALRLCRAIAVGKGRPKTPPLIEIVHFL